MNLDILTSLLNMSTDSTSWVAEVREGFHTASSECCQSLWHSRLKLRVAKLTFNQATDTFRPRDVVFFEQAQDLCDEHARGEDDGADGLLERLLENVHQKGEERENANERHGERGIAAARGAFAAPVPVARGAQRAHWTFVAFFACLCASGVTGGA